MRKFNWLFLIISVFVCLSLLHPEIATSKARNSTQKTLTKKSVSSAATSKKSVARSVDAKRAAVDKTASSERDIWLKRAKQSEALTGKASWYGKDFHNKATASGLLYDMHTFTAAHRTLPMGTIVKVTDSNNGKSVMVCVTDRGPFVKGRIIDVSYAAARKLGLSERGVGNVKLEVVGDENGTPLKKGQAYFVQYASGSGKSKVGPFHAFADAAAMQEALSQAHPEAEVILGKEQK